MWVEMEKETLETGKLIWVFYLASLTPNSENLDKMVRLYIEKLKVVRIGKIVILIMKYSLHIFRHCLLSFIHVFIYLSVISIMNSKTKQNRSSSPPT